MPPLLKAVLFDIDDTLYSTTRFAAAARRAAVEAMRGLGVRAPAASLLKELDETIAEFGSNYEHHFDKLLLRLPRSAIRGLNRSLVIAAAIAAYHDAKFTQLEPFPDVLPALSRLAGTPLKLGIITDGLEIKQAEKLIRLSVLPFFPHRAIFISDQIGISKPNPKIYRRACEDLDVDPGHALYAGDHPVKDIDAANAAGMITALIQRSGKHAAQRGRTRPRYQVRDLHELLKLIARDFKVPLAP
ncbi:MAG: TIGR02253 family HAD-type hydrolase [Planctomycetes bacterium]|nr:TIGR02253 family HAD-type hydrolase [Planctomycetota bacterium]